MYMSRFLSVQHTKIDDQLLWIISIKEPFPSERSSNVYVDLKACVIPKNIFASICEFQDYVTRALVVEESWQERAAYLL